MLRNGLAICRADETQARDILESLLQQHESGGGVERLRGSGRARYL